jgi:phasin family protein
MSDADRPADPVMPTPIDELPAAILADPAKSKKRAAKPVQPAPLPAVAAVAPAAAVADPVPPAAQAPAPTQEEPVMDTVTTVETAANAGADTATQAGEALFGEMNARAKGAMEKGAKMIEELNAFGKGNIEAMVESSKIAAKGLETMAQDAADYARRSFETTSAQVKTLASAKSPTEFFKLQGDYARQSFDAMVAETSRSTEAMLKLAGEIAQPLSNRMAVAASKMKIAA